MRSHRKDILSSSTTDDIETKDHRNDYTNILKHKHLHRFMESMGIHDFSMRDIVAPDSERTCRVLSAIFNYTDFYIGYLSILEQRFTKKLQLETQEKTLAKTLEQNHSKLQEYRVTMSIKKSEIDHEYEKIATLRNEIEKVNIIQEKHKQNITNYESELHKIEIKIQEYTRRKEILQHEVTNLQKSVISSPAMLQKAIHDYRAKMKRDREHIDVYTRNITMIRGINQEYAAANMDAIQLLTEVEIYETEYQKLTQYIQKKNQIIPKIEYATNEVSTIQQENDEYMTRIKTIKDKQYDLQVEYEQKRLRTRIMLDEIKRSKEQLELALEKQQRIFGDHQMKVNAIQREINVMTAEHDQQIQRGRTKLTLLRSSLDSYHQQMMLVLKSNSI